jgi:T5orf172 domain
MPIDISEYTPKKQVYLKVREAHCVYVIAPSKEYPCKIGYTDNIRARFCSIQPGNWIELSVHYLIWTPGKPIALRIESLVHNLLCKAGKRAVGEWFNVNVDFAKKTIWNLALDTYPTIEFVSHSDMIKDLKARPIDKRDHTILSSGRGGLVGRPFERLGSQSLSSREII